MFEDAFTSDTYDGDIQKLIRNTINGTSRKQFDDIEYDDADEYDEYESEEDYEKLVEDERSSGFLYNSGSLFISNKGDFELDRVLRRGKEYVSKKTLDEIDNSIRESIDYDPDQRIMEMLFEEVSPELKNGSVVIMSVTREQGIHSKILAYSLDPSVNPINALWGEEGERIEHVSKALRGERIDIVAWDDNIANRIKNALTGQITNVFVNTEKREAKVVVPDYLLALAIGKDGLNQKLASRMTGYKIEIKSETQAKDAFGFRPEDYYNEDDFEEIGEENISESENDGDTIYYSITEMPHRYHLKYALFEYSNNDGRHRVAALFDDRDLSEEELSQAIEDFIMDQDCQTINDKIIFVDANFIYTVFRSLFKEID